MSLQLAQKPPSYLDTYRIFAHKIQISIPGVDKYSGELTHLGPSRFETIDLSAGIREFVVSPARSMKITERPVSLGNVRKVDVDPTLGGQYLGLSPFSDWLLRIDEPGASVIRAKPPTCINLEFFGTFRTRLS